MSVYAVRFAPVTPKTSGYADLCMLASRLHCALATKLQFNGIDFMGNKHKKMEEYKNYTFPIVVAIVLSRE